MAPRTQSQWFRAWLNRQALPQFDGTYLVRPFGRIPVVYQVDAETRERLIASQVWIARFSIALMLIFILTLQGRSSGMPWGWLGLFVLILSTVSYGTLLFILRHSPRVPRERWVGPPVIDPTGRFPPKHYRNLMLLSAFMAALLSFMLWSIPLSPAAQWELAGVILFFIACAVGLGNRYRHSVRGTKQ